MRHLVALFYYLYGGKISNTSYTMGIEERTLYRIIRSTLCSIVLTPSLHISLDSEAIMRHPRNSVAPWFDEDIRIALDTVPIYVDYDSQDFQPKYQEAVHKVLVATTFSGFIVFVSGLYTGTSPDNTMLYDCGILPEMRRLGIRALADGAFAGPDIVKPPSGPAIWPKRLARGQTMQQYRAAGEAALQQVSLYGFFRARIEHAFSRSRLGRFAAFKNWQGHDRGVLALAVQAAVIANNAEIHCRHGDQGCYPDIDPAVVDAHVQASALARIRYPRRRPLPAAQPPARAGAVARQPRVGAAAVARRNAQLEAQYQAGLAQPNARDRFRVEIERLQALVENERRRGNVTSSESESDGDF
jgi:hypothetical protein